MMAPWPHGMMAAAHFMTIVSHGREPPPNQTMIHRVLNNRIPIVREILVAASVACASLALLILVYGGLEELPPSKLQLGVGTIPTMITVAIWRRYIYHRMHHHQHLDDDVREEGRKGHATVSSSGVLLQQLFPFWYPLSYGVMLLGNWMLPMQVLFSDKLLDPRTGDPYRFNMVCAVCCGFVFVLIGLNLLLDATAFVAEQVVGCAKHQSRQIRRARLWRRRSQRFRAPLTFVASAKIVLGGALMAREDPIVVQVTVPMARLPESLDNFRIIHLSDMHIGVTVGRTRVKRIVEIVNDLCSSGNYYDKCDVVAITGDLIDGEPHGLKRAIEPLAELCRHENVPKVFVTGNHEHIHHNVDHVVTVLSEMGIESLINDSLRLPPDGIRENQLVMIGLDDLSSKQFRGQESEAFDGIDSETDTTILLAHQPNHLGVAERYGVDLMLSGHTHAGQFFPGTVGAWLFNSRFSGFYPSRAGRTAVYVSAGTLWWGPPVRFTTRHHEITDISLVRSQ